MKYITVPAPITFTDIVTDEPIMSGDKPITLGMRAFVFERLVDPKLCEGLVGSEGAFYAADLRGKLKKQDWDAGSVVALEDEDWKRLSTVVKNPTGGYNDRVKHCIVPLLRAILDAASELPAAPAAEEQPS